MVLLHNVFPPTMCEKDGENECGEMLGNDGRRGRGSGVEIVSF